MLEKYIYIYISRERDRAKIFRLVDEISEMGEGMLPCQRFSRDESTSFADKERGDGFGGGSTKGLWMCTRGN